MFFLSRLNVLAIIVALMAYGGIHFFIYFSFIHFFNIQKRLQKRFVALLISFLGLSFFLEFFVPHATSNLLTKIPSSLFGVWMGVLFLLLLASIFLWILEWIHRKAKFRFSFFPIVCFFFVTPLLIIGYGAWQSFSLVITEVTVPVKNVPSYWKDKTIVHLTDLHLREVDQIDFLEQVVEKIQDISPELVVITGDLLDFNSADTKDLLAPFKKLSIPILFATGNHDRNFEQLELNHITLLNNELFEKEGLQIIGLNYHDSSEKADPAKILTNLSFDKNKPTILLYHTPTTIEGGKQGDRYISPNTDFSFVKNSSIDLQLSGHTHGGQFFPASVLTHFIYKGYEKGLSHDGDFSLFVSTGLGTWGPPVRTFVPPEIAVIHLK
jgi:hypothetical protein